MTTVFHHLALPDAVFANPAASILVPIVLGNAVGYATKPDRDDREVHSLRQPPFRPPPEAFGPIWTAFYGLTGYAAYRALGKPYYVGSAARASRSLGAGLYTVQLGLTLAWMPLFFTLRRPVEATVDALALVGINAYLAALWLFPGGESVVVGGGSMTDSAVSDSTVAGWLMVPYVAWLGFTAYLSAGAGHLNGWQIGRSRTERKKDN